MTSSRKSRQVTAVKPNDANRALYDAGYEHQMDLLEAARPLWHTPAVLPTIGDER